MLDGHPSVTHNKHLGSGLKSSIQSNTYSAHAKRESAVPSIPDAQEAHHRAFPHANVHPKAHPHPTHPHQMHTAALSLLASISAPPAGRTALDIDLGSDFLI